MSSARSSGKDSGTHLADAAIEASNLVAAVIAADGRLTDSELDATSTPSGRCSIRR